MTSGRVVLVTGASGWIGRHIVAAFHSCGDQVVAHYRSGEAPRGTLSVRGDLTFDADASSLVDAAAARFGRIDVVVNNAADQMIGESAGEFGAVDIARWQGVMDATLLSAVRVTSAALPHMAPGSSVVNVSSVEASRAFPGRAPYAAAKAALEAYTRALAVDLGTHGIRANAVAPGLVEREGLAQSWPEGYAGWIAASPSGRLVSAAEVADAVRFLAGAAGVNGAVLSVDAGWSSGGAGTVQPSPE